MGENEQGSLLRTVLAIAVYGIITGLFLSMAYAAVSFANKIHGHAYQVN